MRRSANNHRCLSARSPRICNLWSIDHRRQQIGWKSDIFTRLWKSSEDVWVVNSREWSLTWPFVNLVCPSLTWHDQLSIDMSAVVLGAWCWTVFIVWPVCLRLWSNNGCSEMVMALNRTVISFEATCWGIDCLKGVYVPSKKVNIHLNDLEGRGRATMIAQSDIRLLTLCSGAFILIPCGASCASGNTGGSEHCICVWHTYENGESLSHENKKNGG